MTIILTPALESFKYSYQIAEHAAAVVDMCQSQGIERDDMSKFAYVEYLIDECAHTSGDHAKNIAEARVAFDSISTQMQSTDIGKIFTEKLMHEEFLIAAKIAMLGAVQTGICKMSKSGKSVIFATPILGRVDLSGYYPHAKHQLSAAGIVINMGQQ